MKIWIYETGTRVRIWVIWNKAEQIIARRSAILVLTVILLFFWKRNFFKKNHSCKGYRLKIYPRGNWMPYSNKECYEHSIDWIQFSVSPLFWWANYWLIFRGHAHTNFCHQQIGMYRECYIVHKSACIFYAHQNHRLPLIKLIFLKLIRRSRYTGITLLIYMHILAKPRALRACAFHCTPYDETWL